ncbi:MAG TPA: hypothetical protein VII23_16205 [Terriglobales bacterium]
MKELITAALAVAIAYVSLSMLKATFNAVGQPDVFSREKDVLLYSLSLLGTVVGYYFGRVPAELHAQAATAQANKAQNQLQQTQSQLTQMATTAANAGATATNAVASQDQMRQQVKSVLTAVKQNLQQASNPPVAAVLAVPQATGLEQAVAEIDEALKSF